MFRKQHSLSLQLVAAAALALGASGSALADGSSMSRFGGDSYAYFNQPAISNMAAAPAWRTNHPNGPTDRELQAFSSNDLSAFASQFGPPVLASAQADPSWRQSHPNGLTERELEALSSSSLAFRQAPDLSAARTNLARSPGENM